MIRIVGCGCFWSLWTEVVKGGCQAGMEEAGMRRPGACRDLCRARIFSEPKNPGFQGTCPSLTLPLPYLVKCGAVLTRGAGHI